MRALQETSSRAGSASRALRKCPLCQVPSKLHHSHIIPRLMYRPMSRLFSGTPIRVSSQEGKLRPGHLKEHMLCSRCENQFSGHERVAARFLTDLNQIQLQGHERSIRRSSLDYPSLKLFFLSVLWRCAACSAAARRSEERERALADAAASMPILFH